MRDIKSCLWLARILKVGVAKSSFLDESRTRGRVQRTVQEIRAALPFDRHGDGITTSETEGRDSLMHIAADHLIDQRHQNARAAGADGMPDRNRSTVHIYFCRIQADFLHHAQSLHGKRLVQFVEIRLFF